MDGTMALTLIEALLILLGLSIFMAIKSNVAVDDDDSSKDDMILTQTVSPPVTKYDVFLSFRGETRDTFSSYLYEALCNASINTFMDHKLHKGDDISPILLKTIEESEISLIVFSNGYASSSWCMDELVHIMKCKDQYGRIVIPIFYKVDPSNVCKQNGTFGDGFAKLEQRFKHDPEKLKEWTNALIRLTNLSRWDSKNFRPETKLTKMIVKDILSKLNNKSSFHLEELVGIYDQIQKIEELLSEDRIVGIWGMGGIGKTTLVGAVFDRLNAQFEASSFVGNVREQLAKIGLDQLLRKCLKELLKDEGIRSYNIRSTFVKNRLQRKKVLLVLDDVDNSKDIAELIKTCGWFAEGSRVIITSRDMQVLKNAYAFSTYHVPDMDFHDAFHLFSLKAFKQHNPSEGYMELSKSILKYCQGNPLALVVLGVFLYGRGKEEWESVLEKLNEAPPKDIVDVLKLSFDGLDDKQQNVFIDLAFLINESIYDRLDLIQQFYGSSVHIEISVLREKSLISFDQHGYIVMHDLVKKMGLKIARQWLFSNAKTPIRLWRHEDIDYFFRRGKEFEAIRCMSLDVSKFKIITLRANSIGKMHNLIFLKIYKSNEKTSSVLNIRGVLNYFPIELRCFIWEECPLPHVPLHFCAKNLVTLEMRNSNIQQLWNGNQHFPNLKRIDLRHSKHLIALPDLSHAPKMEFMNLEGCVSLAQIHSSTIPRTDRVTIFWLRESGPKQIKVGGSMKGTSSGLAIIYYYLDLEKLSLNKLTLKVFVSGENITGVGFKHVVMSLERKAEVRKGPQNLASSLSFVRKVEWLEDPIEFGDDLNQHFTYSFILYSYYPTREMGDKGERSNDDQVLKTLMKVEEKEEKEELIMECSESNTDGSDIVVIRIPKSTTRWSLLKELILKESYIILMIGNAGGGHKYKTQLDVTYCFPHNIPPPASPQPFRFCILYDFEEANQQCGFPIHTSLHLNCRLTNTKGFPDSIYDSLKISFGEFSLRYSLGKIRIHRKRG